MKLLNTLILVFILVYSSQLSLANVSVADVFSDNMVLQRNQQVQVWGNADPGEKLTLSINGQRHKAKANKAGEWSVQLEPMHAGGPFSMIIIGKNELVLQNILIGDVWVCSGQSNMQWPVSKSNNAEKEIYNGDHPGIRLFTVPKQLNNEPEQDMPNASWQICTPESVKNFSAVGYFFGRDLQEEIDVPIGLQKNRLLNYQSIKISLKELKILMRKK